MKKKTWARFWRVLWNEVTCIENPSVYRVHFLLSTVGSVTQQRETLRQRQSATLYRFAYRKVAKDTIENRSMTSIEMMSEISGEDDRPECSQVHGLLEYRSVKEFAAHVYILCWHDGFSFMKPQNGSSDGGSLVGPGHFGTTPGVGSQSLFDGLYENTSCKLDDPRSNIRML